MKNKIAYWGVFLALALVCSYVESLIPISFGIPGVKLGLTNIVVILMLYTIGAKDAILISVLRIILAGFMFGNAFSIIYSLAGGILSFVVMLLLKKTGKLKILSISTAGGISHNILFYVPVLIIAGIITGFLIGLLAGEIVLRIGNRFKL